MAAAVLMASLFVTASAAAFPSFDPAYWKPGATPPVLHLAPLDAYGDTQLVDGSVTPAEEYPAGVQAHLPDWNSGMAPGDMHLQLAGKQLLVGVRVAPGDCDQEGCGIFLAIDEDRDDTLADLLTPFGPEDRGIAVFWTSPADVQTGQWSGTHGFNLLPPDDVWPFVTRVGIGPDGKFHVELKITLRTTAAVAAQPDLDPRTEPFGLAVAVIGMKEEIDPNQPLDPSYYIWPNEPASTGGQWIAMPRYPYTYKTIQPELPTGEPTQFLTQNAGMLPYLPDGGDGSPNDFAAYAADPGVHVACFQELWRHDDRLEVATIAREAGMHAHGLPHHCGGADDDSCDIGDITWGELSGSGLTVKDTGLLLLSKSPFISTDTLYFKNDDAGCCDADCAEEKGALYARVGTANAKVNSTCPKQGACATELYAGEQYIDVFCTHLQASPSWLEDLATYLEAAKSGTTLKISELAGYLGIDSTDMTQYECDENEHRAIQARQLATLGDWIREKRVGNWALGLRNFTDRPAVVMGDFNINGRNPDNLIPSPMIGGALYQKAATSFEALERTEFEKVTQAIYSAKHDMGLGFRNPTIPYPPIRGTDPVYVDEVEGLAEADGSNPLPISAFGESTMSDATARYDYVWVLAAWPSDELPFFAIANSPEEPYVWTDAHRGGDDVAASDHKATYAGVRFVELAELEVYNPLRPHIVTQRVTHLQTLSYDGGAYAGGEDFFGNGNSAVNGISGLQHSFTAPSDNDSPNVNWAMGVSLQPQDQATWWYNLFEDDPESYWSPPGCCNDRYDMHEWAGTDISTSFDSSLSRWAFHDNDVYNIQLQLCIAGLLANCQSSGSMQTIQPTEGNNSESAIVTNMLDVVEEP